MSDFHNDKAVAGIAGTFRQVSIAKPARSKRKAAPHPFSLRLTVEERARLEQDAGNRPLGAYIRSRLFDGPAPRRGPSRRPVKDQEALARLLGAFGQSRIANNLNQLAKAANSGSFLLTQEGEASLREACDAVTAMRRDLMTALGLDGGGRP